MEKILNYYGILKRKNILINSNSEDIKMKKTTVKEVKLWFKTLEENRYKRTYQSDARRVAWFVNNNLSEDYDTMPISMQKKWDKANYGRERFLAKEYLKHLKEQEKQRKANSKLTENILRRAIRTEIRNIKIQPK